MLAKINVFAECFLKDLNNTLDLFELALDPQLLADAMAVLQTVFIPFSDVCLISLLLTFVSPS